jgi:hypothetical protein
VLEEEQAPARAQDAADLGQRGGKIATGAEHERRDDRVEAAVGERQALGRRLDDLDRRRVVRQRAARARRRRAIGSSGSVMTSVSTASP